jgi:uncharacterized membrane protein
VLFKKRLISKTDEARLIKAIQAAELQTSGEIRVHIEKFCKTDPLEECKKKFTELNMHETKDRNGILFYLAINSKSFAVWGDEGIHQNVDDAFWKSITDCAIGYFKQDELLIGIEKAVELCGEKLKLHFPLQVNDKNELSNDISY